MKVKHKNDREQDNGIWIPESAGEDSGWLPR